jgi:hypothetical protein
MELSKTFRYSEDSPTGIVWAEDRFSGRNYLIKKRSAGDVAGSLGKKGYYLVDFRGRKRTVHQIVWELFNGEIPANMCIDHIDGDKLNNKIDNLRLSDTRTNNRNSNKNTNSKSGVVGVRFIQITNRHGQVFDYWKASWVSLDGKASYINFSVLKLGYEEARNKAIQKRKEMIEYLNEQGAGYTERHIGEF